jgi:hypothetical protein
MKTSILKKAVVAAVGAMAFGVAGFASAAGSITVSNGAANQFSINTSSFDGTSGNIENLTFDLSATLCNPSSGCIAGESLTIDSLLSSGFAYDPGLNGTSAFFQSSSTVFGFNFTGFNPLDIFTFAWDPDVASNSSYGALAGELAGMVITADVRFADNSLLQYSGAMAIVGPDVAANLIPTPVPEPEIYAMLAAGLGLMGFVARRRKQAGAVV